MKMLKRKNIVDYFYVCGVDCSVGDQNCINYNNLHPLDRPYKCRVLQHFPEHIKNLKFDEESTALVTMPHGLNLCVQGDYLNTQCFKPRVHTFIITREDGTRIHGLALLFAEIVDHDNIKNSLETLEVLYNAEIKSKRLLGCRYNKNKDFLFAMKAIGLLSSYAFTEGLCSWLEDLWSSIYLGSLCFPKHKLEIYIRDLLFNTMLPDVGHFAHFKGPFRTHHCFLPAPANVINNLMNGYFKDQIFIELPLFEYAMSELFDLIGIDDFIRLFTSTLLEYRIILFSHSYNRLMLVSECVTCLLFPFYWPHVYAPILPVPLVHFVDAPVPFVMGLNFSAASMPNKYKHRLFRSTGDSARCDSGQEFDISDTLTTSSIELASEANVCYVHIDEGRVVVPDEVPQFPNVQSVKQMLVDILTVAKLLFVRDGQHFHNFQTSKSPVRTPTQSDDAKFVCSDLTEIRSSTSHETAPVLRPKPPISFNNLQESQRRFSYSSKVGTMKNNHQSCWDNASENKVAKSSQDKSNGDGGSINELTNYLESCKTCAQSLVSTDRTSRYAQLLHFNTVIRNVFLKNFALIFADYEHYLIIDHHHEDAVSNTKTSRLFGLQAFDKMAFLSDQPETHLPFLSAFLETQMFASFLDMRLNWHSTFEYHSNRGLLILMLTSSSSLVSPSSTATSSTSAPTQVGNNTTGSMAQHPIVNQMPMNLSIFHLVLAQLKLGTKTLFDVRRPIDSTTPTVLCMPNKSGTNFPALDDFEFVCDDVIDYPTDVQDAIVKHPLPDLLYGAPSSNLNVEPRKSQTKTAPPVCCPLTKYTFPKLLPLILTPPVNEMSTEVYQTQDLRQSEDCVYSAGVSLTPPIYHSDRSHFLSVPKGLTRVSPPTGGLAIQSGFMSTPTKRAISFLGANLTDNSGPPTNEQPFDVHNSSLLNGKSHHYVSGQFHGHHPRQLTNLQRGGMAQAHWDFVDALLEECKYRTKRMVLKKIGQEAVEMGHGDPTVSVVEENTLVSGLCDLLERIWSHGLDKKLGKSALWSHLVLYARRHGSTAEGRLDSDGDQSNSSNSSSCTNSPCCPPTTAHHRPSLAGKSRAFLHHSCSPESRRKPTMGETKLDAQHQLSNCQQSVINETGSRRFPWNTSTFDTEVDLFSNGKSGSMRPIGWRNRFQFADSARSKLFANILFDSTGNRNVTCDLRKIFGTHVVEHSLVADIMAIQAIKSMKTDFGFARAFVRLALEKKLLSVHLTVLLKDAKLLRYLYNRHAFLRCEDEREQFLVHLLSLNAVDYYSFTRMINQAEVVYEVFVCNGRKHNVPTSANCWIKLNGHLGSTTPSVVARGYNLIEIKHRNLGILTTIQLGHDNSGSSARWFVEFVLVRNRMTNHFYLFSCNHWFGLGIEDDALERILVGDHIPMASNDPYLVFTPPSTDPVEYTNNMPNRCTSPSLSKRGLDQKNLNPIIIHERVASSVSRLMKYFCKAGRQNPNISLTSMWCGDQGLVHALHLVFNYAFRSNRLFQRKLYVWDYLEKVASAFAIELGLTSKTAVLQPTLSQPNKTPTKQTVYSTYSLPRSVTRRMCREMSPLITLIDPNEASSNERREVDCIRPMHPSSSVSGLGDLFGGSAAQPGLYSFSQPNSPAISRLVQPNRAHRTEEFVCLGIHSLPDIRQIASQFVNYVQTVTTSSTTLGKDGKFQRFICRSIKDRLLSHWLSLLALSSITIQMYEPHSFLLNHDLRQAVQSLLISLEEYDFPFEAALLG